MRRSAALLVLLSGTLALAQAPTQQPNPAAKTEGSVVLRLNRLDNLGCPVGFSASRQGGLQVMNASDAEKQGPAQGLHLMLSRLATPAIERIEVTVYAMSLKPVVMPAGQQADAAISKTFEFTRQAGSESLNEADVWLHNSGALTRVDLNAITYADGTTWHATDDFKCRAIPSNLLLVGSK
jgi:hypothetical protein